MAEQKCSILKQYLEAVKEMVAHGVYSTRRSVVLCATTYQIPVTDRHGSTLCDPFGRGSCPDAWH